MALCALAPHEVGTQDILDLRDKLFDEEDDIGEDKSIYARWYRSAATRDSTEKRVIAWKSGKTFDPKNVYFRTLDTGRLIPMEFADFRLQVYAHRSAWNTYERHIKIKTPRTAMRMMTLTFVSSQESYQRDAHFRIVT